MGGRFDPEMWYEMLEKYKVTVWYSAPRITDADECGDALVSDTICQS
jgi:acyl-coenzyme A synthetase/AMP-(fatty) acid ligase